jgi:L-cysteine desulfidase
MPVMSYEKRIIEALRAEVKPAMGCTEPVAVALAVAKARELCQFGDQFNSDALKIIVSVSPNIFKNGLSVGIPGTDQVGLVLASALGFTSGQSSNGLEVFKDVNASDISMAMQLIDQKAVKLSIADTDKKIYIEAVVSQGINFGRTVIEVCHDRFVHLESHLGVHFTDAFSENAFSQPLKNPLYDLPIYELIQHIEKLPFDEIAFLLEGFEMNETIARYGLSKPCGMSVGLTLQQNTDKGILSDDLMNRAMILTAAASDARMSGISLPVMSSNGSGNNGITALMPIVAYANTTPTSADSLARAAAISHMINSVIKSNIGRLSALCGCGVAAGTGAAVALTWLMGASKAQLEGAVQNMIANTTGMICDGAKVGCSLKLATSASAAVQSALLAIGGIIVPTGNGIIGPTADDTIVNLGYLSRHAMDTVDHVILGVMTEHL